MTVGVYFRGEVPRLSLEHAPRQMRSALSQAAPRFFAGPLEPHFHSMSAPRECGVHLHEAQAHIDGGSLAQLIQLEASPGLGMSIARAAVQLCARAGGAAAAQQAEITAVRQFSAEF